LSGSLSATVKRTTDGGVTWDTTESKPQGISSLFMSYIPGTIGSYVITAGTSHGPLTGSAYTVNNGATWTIVDHESHGKAAFVSPSVGWSGGGADSIYKWTGGALPVRETGGGSPSRFELSQNYPNPFNPTTVVSYQLPVASWVKLAVYDVLGREVAVLVNEKKDPGRYQVRWDAGNCPSGVYFCRMTADEFAGTTKMLFVR
jgi:hypothetical protein